MFWWFERGGRYLRCETRLVRDDRYEFVATLPDGVEQVVESTERREMIERQKGRCTGSDIARIGNRPAQRGRCEDAFRSE